MAYLLNASFVLLAIEGCFENKVVDRSGLCPALFPLRRDVFSRVKTLYFVVAFFIFSLSRLCLAVKVGRRRCCCFSWHLGFAVNAKQRRFPIDLSHGV